MWRHHRLVLVICAVSWQIFNKHDEQHADLAEARPCCWCCTSPMLGVMWRA
jgi:hypothetical protein